MSCDVEPRAFRQRAACRLGEVRAQMIRLDMRQRPQLQPNDARAPATLASSDFFNLAEQSAQQ